MFSQAKESWEMDLNEKLERAVLVKQKGHSISRFASIFVFGLSLSFLF